MPLPNRKNFLRDVLPKESLSSSNSGSRRLKEEEDVIYHRVQNPVLDLEEKKGGWRIWLVATIAVLFLTFSIFQVFSSAEVFVIPRIGEASLSGDFKIKAEGSAELSKGELFFEPVSFEKTVSKEVVADGEKEVSRKSSGTIIVYNNYSENSQKLIKNTRFETTDGLIYRIDKSIVIPGKSIVAGKTVPGSVEATVYADEAGPKYNIGLVDFTIPGFKSDPGRYNGFYARSKTPMTDGFSGMAKFVSDSKQKLSRAEMRSSLEKEMFLEASQAMKDGYFIPKGAYTIEFESLPLQNAENGQVSLKEKGKLVVFSFVTEYWDRTMAFSAPFSGLIASSTVILKNRDILDFSWKLRPKIDSPEISFSVDGMAHFVWAVDGRKLAGELAGARRSDFEEILKNYGEIESANVSIYPFWRKTFPGDSAKIKVVISEN